MLLLTLLHLARAEPCATPEVLEALRTGLPGRHSGMLSPPPGLSGRPTATLTGGKPVYGTPYDDHLNTANFSINWWSEGVTDDVAARAADALETAWASLVIDQGWTPPVSSDGYLLWVLLDPSLGGTTGYTTEYFTPDFREGYPVIYLNPTYGWDEPFWASLAAHEFMHALQFAIREWDGAGGAVESWYWEASATHASELADPNVDGHQYTSAWYASQTALDHWSTSGSHQYGMFVLNAWLDEEEPATMQAVWAAGDGREDSTWDELIAEVAGRPAEEVWAAFSGAFGNQELTESRLYSRAVGRGLLVDGASGTLGDLGTDYWQAAEPVLVSVVGDAVLGGPGGASGSTLLLEPGEVLGVTGFASGAAYSLAVEPPPDTGTTPTGTTPTGTTGSTTSSSTTTATTGAGDQEGDTGGLLTPSPGACGCGTGVAVGWGGWGAVALLAALRRRG